MEIEILSELTNIKWLLVALLISFLVLVAVFTIFLLINLSMRRNAIHAELSQDFVSEAQRHLDKGRFDELYQISKQRTSEYTHDTSAFWFLAIAHYNKQEYAPALEAFAKIQHLDPTWQKFSVEDYIEEIRANMKGPQGTASNKSLNQTGANDAPPD